MSEQIDIPTLAGIVGAMAQAGVVEIEFEAPGSHLQLRLAPHPTPLAAMPDAPAPPAPTIPCLAPNAGHLVLQHPASEAPLMASGALVAAGDTLALIQTGSLLRPVLAPVAGRLLRWLAEPGALVGHGAPLAEIDPETSL
jgi:biotin carboxyl carrier protein